MAKQEKQTEQPDPTVVEYEKMLTDIEEMASRAAYWDEHGPDAKGSPWAELLTAISDEVDQETVEVGQYVPVGKDLNDRVYKIRGRMWALDHIRQLTRSTGDELRSLRHRKGVLEAEYPVLLAAAGYDVEVQAPDVDGPPQDDGGGEWPDTGIVRVWFDSEPDPDELTRGGFVQGEEDGEWRAPITTESEDFVMGQHAGGNVLTTLFEADEAQSETAAEGNPE